MMKCDAPLPPGEAAFFVSPYYCVFPLCQLVSVMTNGCSAGQLLLRALVLLLLLLLLKPNSVRDVVYRSVQSCLDYSLYS
jgi:hypothetical protein